MKHIIDLYCVCWNEIKVLPFVIDYWKRFVRHAYVYDNGSDDGTIEYLNQFEWITVIPFETDGFNDQVNMDIKNNVWKNSDADYVVVCDLDECLYSEDLEHMLTLCDKHNIDVIAPSWYDVYYWDFPKYINDKLLHENANALSYADNVWTHKAILFKPNNVEEMNYHPGCHECQPKHKGKILICLKEDDLKILHCKNLGIDYLYERCQTLEKRRSELNRQRGWGTHYNITKEDIKKNFNKVILGGGNLAISNKKKKTK